MLDERGRALIALKVAQGVLCQPTGAAVFGGRSNGKECAACERPIARGDMEIEIVDAHGRSHCCLHVACHEYLGVLANAT